MRLQVMVKNSRSDEDLNEAELIQHARSGDATAFNALIVVYQELAYNVCYRTLGDAEAAADATQEAFLSAFQAMRGFRGGSFKVWLLRIAVNGCYDQLRRRKRHTSSRLEDAMADSLSASSFTDREAGPEEQVLRRELLAYVEQGLALLPTDQKLTVTLSDLQGFSYEEIAQVMQVSLGTVKSRLSRARCHLRDFLMQHRELLPPDLRHDSVR